MSNITASIQQQIHDYTAANEEEFKLVQCVEILLAAVHNVMQIVDQPDIITHHPGGSKTAYLDADRVHAAIETTLLAPA